MAITDDDITQEIKEEEEAETLELISRTEPKEKEKTVQIQIKSLGKKSSSFTIKGTDDVQRISGILFFTLKNIINSKKENIKMVYKNLLKEEGENDETAD